MQFIPGPNHPVRYEISYQLRKLARHAGDFIQSGGFVSAQKKSDSHLTTLIQSHETPIFRKLSGVDPELFENKKTNLKIALDQIGDLSIPPGKSFSFWRIVGKPTLARGFKPGLVISQGQPKTGVGGGLCQLSNTLFWLALHTEMQVIERHRHSFDLFPDDSRQVPFGTGATVFYNYKDLRIFNSSPWTYQFRLRLTSEQLTAQVFCSEALPYSYQIKETDHRFIKTSDGLFRENLIWKVKKDLDGTILSKQFLFKNKCRCQYEI